MDEQQNIDYWLQQIESQKKSKLSLAEYCRRQGITENRFAYWRRKLQGTAVSQKLIPITITSPVVRNSSYCTIEYPHGVKLRVEDKELLNMLPQLLLTRT
ncbi:MAG: hypothetical protein H8D23_38770 [Candidatus Brocadiales bacterium]|nr:hypothetical protein [Candidatus Brocadiales bacterium]